MRLNKAICVNHLLAAVASIPFTVVDNDRLIGLVPNPSRLADLSCASELPVVLVSVLILGPHSLVLNQQVWAGA